ncbi:MAG: mechanosensitive ion channel family protein [Candidatus Promineifilaceae bacterium]|nr:mechanosensitive ion channel family protein [Candidatus Promineifilaceae bacterium]
MDAFLDGVISRLQEFFDPALLGAQIAELVTDFVVFAVIFTAFYLLWLVVRRPLQRVLAQTKLDETAITFVETVAKYTILLVGVVNAMAAAGIQTASVLASLGIAGLTIGFAARDAFSNLISGLLIFLDRPFVIGDLVEIEDNYGRVDQITLRSTRIVTVDGKMLAVPNSDIINKTVASYTNFPHLRLDIDLTVGVNEDLNRVRQVLLEVIGDDPAYMEDPPARVVVTQINDYNVAVSLQAWLHDEREHVTRRFDLRERAFDALNAAGVEMPFETLQLRPLEIRSLDAALPS